MDTMFFLILGLGLGALLHMIGSNSKDPISGGCLGLCGFGIAAAAIIFAIMRFGAWLF